ncbi:MAG: AAA family ATPase [bacterium]
MEYYSLLGLQKEPFSNSPDPGFFYYSPEYQECLQRLEISIRLRRGLNIILGNIGTGKTTISRILVNMFKKEKDRFLFHLILDPSFRSEFQFLSCLNDTFGIAARVRSTVGYKEALQDYLFQKGVHEEKIIVLLIDEGQKLTSPYIEILRNLLNFETNEYKLLQLIILAQMEFLDIVAEHKNFMDRVNISYTINPLSLAETRDLIRYRLQRAGLPPENTLFDDEAIQYIHLQTQGYPRKIIQFCHHALVMTLIHEKRIVDLDIVQAVQEKSIFSDDELIRFKKNLQGLSRSYAQLQSHLHSINKD